MPTVVGERRPIPPMSGSREPIFTIFRIEYIIRVGMINPTFLSLSLKERCYGNRFWRELANIVIPHLHSVCWHSTVNGSIAAWMCALTPNYTPYSVFMGVIEKWRRVENTEKRTVFRRLGYITAHNVFYTKHLGLVILDFWQ